MLLGVFSTEAIIPVDYLTGTKPIWVLYRNKLEQKDELSK